MARRRWLQGGGLVLAGAGAIAGAFVGYDHRGYHTPSNAGVVPGAALTQQAESRPAVNAVAAPAARPTHHARRKADPAAGRPVRLAIRSISVDAPVVAVTIDHGALGVPEDPQTLGWWSHGARPGAATGSAVIDGHVDSWQTGAGALYHLESVPMGARVTVTTDHGTLTYKVVGRRVYSKQALPASVFVRTGPPRLVLITCGGPFDAATRHYRDNVVVYAVPA